MMMTMMIFKGETGESQRIIELCLILKPIQNVRNTRPLICIFFSSAYTFC